MYRFFAHYYLQALPFLTLAFGASVDAWLRARVTARQARLVVASFVLFTLFASALDCYFYERLDGRVAHDRTVQDLGRFIARTTRPDDRIFVWGFSSWLYGYSHRRPAGRYVFATYVTGFVPWFWDKLEVEKARIVPGSVEALLGDLEREKPMIVVDAGSVMMARPMRAYDAPSAWLHEHYCFELRVGALDVYRRKAPEVDECATPFPYVHAPVNWNGRSLDPVRSPRTVDFDASRLLPQRGDSPAWFADGPLPPGLEALKTPRDVRDDAEAHAEGLE
jgi:hypothetical protein